MKIITNSYRKTQEFGEEFARKLLPGDILLLYGNLGSGKTTFMQGLAKGLGIKRRIISPTFIITRRYEINAQPERVNLKYLYHIDLYRTDSKDLKGLGLTDILQEKDIITAIEWPEKLGKFLPKKRLELNFTTIDENTREIEINSYE